MAADGPPSSRMAPPITFSPSNTLHSSYAVVVEPDVDEAITSALLPAPIALQRLSSPPGARLHAPP